MLVPLGPLVRRKTAKPLSLHDGLSLTLVEFQADFLANFLVEFWLSSGRVLVEFLLSCSVPPYFVGVIGLAVGPVRWVCDGLQQDSLRKWAGRRGGVFYAVRVISSSVYGA